MVLQDDDSQASSRRPPAVSTHTLSPASEDAIETPLDKYCSCGTLDERPIQVGNVVFCHSLKLYSQKQ